MQNINIWEKPEMFFFRNDVEHANVFSPYKGISMHVQEQIVLILFSCVLSVNACACEL